MAKSSPNAHNFTKPENKEFGTILVQILSNYRSLYKFSTKRQKHVEILHQNSYGGSPSTNIEERETVTDAFQALCLICKRLEDMNDVTPSLNTLESRFKMLDDLEDSKWQIHTSCSVLAARSKIADLLSGKNRTRLRMPHRKRKDDSRHDSLVLPPPRLRVSCCTATTSPISCFTFMMSGAELRAKGKDDIESELQKLMLTKRKNRDSELRQPFPGVPNCGNQDVPDQPTTTTLQLDSYVDENARLMQDLTVASTLHVNNLVLEFWPSSEATSIIKYDQGHPVQRHREARGPVCVPYSKGGGDIVKNHNGSGSTGSSMTGTRSKDRGAVGCV
ncbi:hypothetical protein C8R45DRAFT_1134339 [Mycena sanguinolenta]|nr:hypothetical protein C8R45DRAFT_1134339 [Mycena sanguinolenta]